MATELLEPLAGDNGHRTARRAVEQLAAHDAGYRVPTRCERDALTVAFAKRRMTLHHAAFDAVHCEEAFDILDEHALAANLDRLTICEVKSTNRPSIGDDLRGYFFNVTAAELLTAQSLGRRYKFLFVNTVTGTHQEMALSEVFGRARATYPAWHIRF